MKAPKFNLNQDCILLYLDTEQSKTDIRRFGTMILKLTGKTYLPNLKSYSLRGLSPTEKILLIGKIIRKQGKTVLAVIDNVRDLCFDINNQKEALEVILFIQQLVDEGHHIILVLHVTRGTEDAGRGALGTEALNRAENIYRIVKEGNKGIVKPVHTRGKTFDEFAFAVDKDGLPYLIDDWIKAKETKTKGKQKLEPSGISQEDYKAVLQEIFNKSGQLKTLSRIELVKELIKIFKTKGIEFGESKAREFISYLLEKEMIGKTMRLRGTTKKEVFGLKSS
jgi:hypothetical protein